jgi:hypothetical protein
MNKGEMIDMYHDIPLVPSYWIGSDRVFVIIIIIRFSCSLVLPLFLARSDQIASESPRSPMTLEEKSPAFARADI